VFQRFLEEMVEPLYRGRAGVERGAVLRLGQGGGERFREQSAPQVRGCGTSGKLFEDNETERSNATASTLVSLSSGARVTSSAGCASYVLQNDLSPSPWLYDQRAVSLAVSCSALSANLTNRVGRFLRRATKPKRHRSLDRGELGDWTNRYLTLCTRSRLK
jgi:hypothetical protein